MTTFFFSNFFELGRKFFLVSLHQKGEFECFFYIKNEDSNLRLDLILKREIPLY